MSVSGKDFWAPSGGSSPVPKCQVHWGEAPLARRRKGVAWQSWGPGQWPQTPCPALSAPRHAPSWLKDAPAHRAPGTRAGSQGWLGLSASVKTRQESAVPRPSPCPGAWQPHSGLLVRAGRRRPGARPSSGPSRQGPGRGWAGAGREDTASPHTAEQGLPHERASLRRRGRRRPAGQGLPSAADFYGDLGSVEGNVPRPYKHVQVTDGRGHGWLGPPAAGRFAGRSLGPGANSSLLKCDIPLPYNAVGVARQT